LQLHVELGGRADHTVPATDEALVWLEEAARLAGDDPHLLALALCNALHYRVEFDQAADRDELVEQLERVRTIESQRFGAVEHWPPMVLAAVAWSGWMLHPEPSPALKSETRRHLEIAMTSPDLGGDERERIMRHLAALDE
jgi:hypothetical protein